MNKIEKILVGAVVILALGGLYLFFTQPHNSGVVSSIYPDEATGFTNVAVNGYLTVGDTFSVTGASAFGSTTIGTSGTRLNNVISGKCFIHAYATTVSGQGNALADCEATTSPSTLVGIAGVQNGDRVIVQLSTTTAVALAPAVDLVGANASTTNGFIQLSFINATSTAYTWTATGTTSPVTFIDIR